MNAEENPMLRKLDEAASEYVLRKEAFDDTRVAFEVAKAQLAATKALALDAITDAEYSHWVRNHEGVRYAGDTIGDAITQALADRAFQAQYIYIVTGEPTAPVDMALDELLLALKAGGFEFRSVAPLRELNAALINLNSVEKLPDGRYRHADFERIMNEAKTAAHAELAEHD